MKKKIEIYFNSLKQSVFYKPMALAMFILMVIVATVACGLPSRMLVSEAEQEIYPSSPNLAFVDSSQYVQVGEYMRNKRDTHFDYYQNTGCFQGTVIGEEINVDGKKIKLERVEIDFEVFAGKLTENDIINGKQVMYVDKFFSDNTGLNKGDSFVFCGSEFLIVDVANRNEYDSSNNITIPFSAQLVDTKNVKIEYLRFYGLKKNFDDKIYEELGKIGVIKGKEYANSPIIQSVIMLVALLLASALSVISVTNYWQSVNMRKYRLYKAVGASPKTVGGIMFFETGVVAALSVGVGLVFDYIMSLVVNIGSITRMLWLHYLILFLATFFAIMIMVSVKIVKIAKAMPVSSKLAKR